jgi:hypothetical protein
MALPVDAICDSDSFTCWHVLHRSPFRAGINPAPTILRNPYVSAYADDPWLKRVKEGEARILAIPEDQLPELTEKQIERIAAFENREDR